MKLRNKVTVILLVLWCVLMVITYVGSHFILGKSYLDLERNQAQDNLQRIVEAIDQMDESVKSMTASWAVWDDTYKFIDDLNPAYAKTNLNVSSFATSDVDVMLYYNAAGKLVASMAVNADRTQIVEQPQDFMHYLAPQGKFIFHGDEATTIDGLVSVPTGILLIAEHPILTSENKGPSHGTLIMAKYLNDNAINKIRHITKSHFTINRLDAPVSNETNRVFQSLSDKGDYLIEWQDSDNMTGYTLLKDINQKPIAIVKLDMPRSISHFGVKTIRYYNIATFIYSVLLLGLLWYLLQTLLVERLERLKAQIGNTTDDHHYDKLITGLNDEVSSVASLYHQAMHDPLTGLANRNMLDQVFNNNVSISNRNASKIALLFLDVDYFKRVNDTLGHEIGDMLLVEVATRLNTCLRDNDLAVRLGGDEFVVMLADIDVAQIKFVVQRILATLIQPMKIQGHELYVTVSMGISIYPDDGQDITSMLKSADIALYHVKENGRNHYQYYSEKLNQAILDANRKETELQQALDNKELCLFYQPIFNLRTGKIVSVEALLRWRHPQKGILTAGEILPIAEKSGLIVPIGNWALVTACQHAKQWQQQGLPAIPVAVNISLEQTKNTSINYVVTNALKQTGLHPTLLELELTETSYINITESILTDLQQLKMHGVRLAIDDFGVGFSGLGYLRRMPVSSLKIDRSFIKNSNHNSEDNVITLAIIALAHQLNLKVVAEGVETIEQLQFLKSNKADCAQGNYLCAPLSERDCANYLASLIEETV